MYLSKKNYVQNWDHEGPERKHEITVKQGGQVREDIKPERITHIIEQVAYWRKANAIHKWFVDQCQGGVDECQETYVSAEKLQELVDLCKQVLNTVETVEGNVCVGKSLKNGEWEEMTEDGHVVAQKGLADSLLPTASGFFFGNTDYDEYYLRNLRDTVEQLEPLLAGGGDFYYQSSW